MQWINASNLDASVHVPSVQIFIFSMTYCRLQLLLLGLCICSVQITLYDLGRDENVKNVAAWNIWNIRKLWQQLDAFIIFQKHIIFQFFICPPKIHISYLIDVAYIYDLHICFTFGKWKEVGKWMYLKLSYFVYFIIINIFSWYMIPSLRGRFLNNDDV